MISLGKSSGSILEFMTTCGRIELSDASSGCGSQYADTKSSSACCLYCGPEHETSNINKTITMVPTTNEVLINALFMYSLYIKINSNTILDVVIAIKLV